MEPSELEKLQYPIGKFVAPKEYTRAFLANSIQSIATFPQLLRNVVSNLSETQLDTPYRPGGWTVRQVVQHCADSHMNCYIRLKWTLTEEAPTIKYYFEDRWAEGADNLTMPIAPTLSLLDGLHYRLHYIMKNLSESELQKIYIHPEHQKEFSLKEMIGVYAWHGHHHLAHITSLIARNGW